MIAALTTMPEMKAILVTGASGQLGRSLKAIISDYPQYVVTFVNRDVLDLSNPLRVANFFIENTFDIIINCAAYTAVDKAESEPELANMINHLAVKQLADIAVEQQAKLIHISTDYVFNGQQHRPYIETDEVDPQGVYGKTKLAGEQAVFQAMPTNALIIRTSWVYSEFGNNFVKTMLRLGAERESLSVVYDQIGAPTYARDLARGIMTIVGSYQFKQEDINSELYHYSNEGVCSWYDFAKAVFEQSNINCEVLPIETNGYPTPAKRPHYSVLNKTKIKDNFCMKVPYWLDGLKQMAAVKIHM